MQISALTGVTSALVQLSVAGDERWWTTCRRFYRLVNASGEQCVDQCFGLIKRCRFMRICIRPGDNFTCLLTCPVVSVLVSALA